MDPALTSAVAAGTTPTGFAFGDGGAFIFFEGAAHQQLYELGFDPQVGWAQSTAMTAIGQAAGATPTSFAYETYLVRVYFVAAGDGAIHELSYETSYGWEVSGALTSAVAPGTSPVRFPYGVTGGVRVYFVGPMARFTSSPSTP